MQILWKYIDTILSYKLYSNYEKGTDTAANKAH